MKVHRALILALMMALGLGILALMLSSVAGSWDSRSLIALLVVVVAAAVGGIAFSWRRYFGKKA